jgi:hypothetical protein
MREISDTTLNGLAVKLETLDRSDDEQSVIEKFWNAPRNAHRKRQGSRHQKTS